jgi:hypothetical protein
MRAVQQKIGKFVGTRQKLLNKSFSEHKSVYLTPHTLVMYQIVLKGW